MWFSVKKHREYNSFCLFSCAIAYVQTCKTVNVTPVDKIIEAYT